MLALLLITMCKGSVWNLLKLNVVFWTNLMLFFYLGFLETLIQDLSLAFPILNTCQSVPQPVFISADDHDPQPQNSSGR